MDKCAVLDAADQRTNASQVRTGKVLINLLQRVVSVDDQPVHLTGKEYSILELLSMRKGTTMTKQMILDHLYGGVAEPDLKIIDVFVCKLRKKLAQATSGNLYHPHLHCKLAVHPDVLPPASGDTAVGSASDAETGTPNAMSHAPAGQNPAGADVEPG